MRKFWTIILAVGLALSLIGPVTAQATFTDMWAYVYSWDGKMSVDGKPTLTRITSGVTFKVLAIDSDTAETLYVYNDDTMTSLTNPITTTYYASDSVCKDRVSFRVDPTDSSSDRYVDLIVVDTAGGYTTFVENFDKYNHAVIIDERPGVIHNGMIWVSGGSGTETTTGIDFDYDTRVLGVQLEVVTAEATGSATFDAGTSEDPDGFLNGVSLAAAGYIQESITTSGASFDDTDFFMNGASIDSNDEQTMTYTCATGDCDRYAAYLHYRFTRTR